MAKRRKAKKGGKKKATKKGKRPPTGTHSSSYPAGGLAAPRRCFAGALDDLRDLPGLETARADAEPLDAAADLRADGYQIGEPPPLRHIVGVANLMAHRGTLAADIATLSHAAPWRWCSSREAPGCRKAERREARAGTVVCPKRRLFIA